MLFIFNNIFLIIYIRCQTLNFMVSKSQKKIIKKIAKYLKDGKTEDDNKRKILDGTKNRHTTLNDVGKFEFLYVFVIYFYFFELFIYLVMLKDLFTMWFN